MLAPDVLLDRMPSRGRVLSECALVLTLLLVPGLARNAAPEAWSWYVLGGAGVLWGGWALALTARRGLAALVAVAGTAIAIWTAGVEVPKLPPRLGVQLADREGSAEVTSVTSATPADGRLRAGDRILAVADQLLDPKVPSADLRARLADEKRTPPGPTRLTIARGGSKQEVTVPLGRIPRGPQLSASLLGWLVARSVAVLVIIAAVLYVDGQSARHIGLEPSRLGRELLYGAPVLMGTLVVHISLSVPIGLLLSKTAFLSRETSQRVAALQGLVADVKLWQFALAMIVLAGFEEIVFRGFLLPRSRHLVGRWWLAVLVVQVLFGLGHLYEGALAVLQTTVLGVCFSLAFLWRGHLGSAIAAHAAFNTLVFTLLVALQRSGLLERLG
jgi:membrane protease YdiL (CAAX protease family)